MAVTPLSQHASQELVVLTSAGTRAHDNAELSNIGEKCGINLTLRCLRRDSFVLSGVCMCEYVHMSVSLCAYVYRGDGTNV